MKLKPIIKAFLPIVLGTILTVAVIIFVLLQLTAASYLVLLVTINVLVFWWWIKSNANNAKNDKYYDYLEFRDRLEGVERNVEDVLDSLKTKNDECN